MGGWQTQKAPPLPSLVGLAHELFIGKAAGGSVFALIFNSPNAGQSLLRASQLLMFLKQYLFSVHPAPSRDPTAGGPAPGFPEKGSAG